MRFRLILLLAALLAFGGALWAPFQFDDHSLLADPSLRSPEGWKLAFTAAQTRPLTFLSFWAQLQFSSSPWTFHLVSLLLHLLCVFLASLAFAELLPRRAAEVASAVFAANPLQTEAVVYVFSRAILLATAFSLLSVLLWWRKRYWAAAAVFLLALLSKEEVAALPLLLLLLEWSTRRCKETLAPALTMLACSLAAGLRVIYATAVTPGAPAGFQAGIGPLEYFVYQGVAILRYLWLMMAPLGLNVNADVRVSPPIAGLAWGVLLIVVLLSWRTIRAAQPGFWIIGGLILLLPSSSFFPAADLAADRRMYLPMLCFAALFGQLLARADWRLLTGYIAILVGLSFAQTRVWQSPQALWMDSARLSPNLVRPKRQLARVSPPEQAVVLLEEARRLAPDDPAVATDLGLAFLRLHRPELALQEFGRRLALEPNSPEAIHNRGLALLVLGQTDAARADFERALSLDACLFDAYWNLKRIGVQRQPPSGCRWTPEQFSTWRATASAK